MGSEPDSERAQTLAELWQRRLTALRSSLVAAPAHPLAWLDRIRLRILVFLLARHGEWASGTPAASRRYQRVIAWRRWPSAVEGTPPRAGKMLRPFLLDIAEWNFARIREAIAASEEACARDRTTRSLHPCGRERR